MVDFKIVKNLNETSQKRWDIPLASENDGKLFDAKAQKIQSTFEGR